MGYRIQGAGAGCRTQGAGSRVQGADGWHGELELGLGLGLEQFFERRSGDRTRV